MKHLRFLLVAVIAFGLLLVMGCCNLTAPDGTVTKSTANCFKVAQDKVCNASSEVVATADVVINLVKPFVATALPGSTVFLVYVTAQNIKSVGCATIADLNQLIAFIQGYNVQTKMAMKSGMMKMAPATINVQPLIDWRNGVK